MAPSDRFKDDSSNESGMYRREATPLSESPQPESESSSTTFPIESLVEQWLEREANSEEVRAAADRLYSQHLVGALQVESADRTVDESPARRSKDEVARKRNSFRRWTVALALLASAACIAVMVAPQGSWIENEVNADAMLSAAHATHNGPMERIYQVQIKRELSGDDSELPNGFVQSVRISTQGDRFWVEMNRGPREWIWGRESDGSIWIVLGPHAAIRLAPDEIGEPLRRMSEMYSLSIGQLLQELPRGFELREIATEQEGRYAVEGSLRRPRSSLGVRRVTAEIDRDTHEVQQLSIERRLPEQTMTTTYTLIESKPADTALYAPEGHLEDMNRVIDSRVSLDRRREILIRRLGPVASRWIR